MAATMVVPSSERYHAIERITRVRCALESATDGGQFVALRCRVQVHRERRMAALARRNHCMHAGADDNCDRPSFYSQTSVYSTESSSIKGSSAHGGLVYIRANTRLKRSLPSTVGVLMDPDSFMAHQRRSERGNRACGSSGARGCEWVCSRTVLCVKLDHA